MSGGMSTACRAEIRSLLPVFALDALDDEERDAVREHVDGCLRCSMDVAELAHTASLIDAAQPAPPDELWSRIVADVRGRAGRSVPDVDDDVAPPAAGSTAPLVTRRRVQQVTATATAADVDLLRLTSRVTRELLWVETAADAAEIVAGLVCNLGGTVVLAELQDPNSIPIDISFGAGEPAFPACPPLSVSRMLLEEVLPVVVEDARRAIASARERRRPKP